MEPKVITLKDIRDRNEVLGIQMGFGNIGMVGAICDDGRTVFTLTYCNDTEELGTESILKPKDYNYDLWFEFLNEKSIDLLISGLEEMRNKFKSAK